MNRVSVRLLIIGLVCAVVILAITLSIPTILRFDIEQQQNQSFALLSNQFPVTVNPQQKTIVESQAVNAFLERPGSPLQAGIGYVGGLFGDVFTRIAVAIADAPWFESIAAVTIGTGGDTRFVSISAGMRKEQVASAFASALSWNAKQKQEFLTAGTGASLPLIEGSFSPGIYSVAPGTSPSTAQALVNDRFTENVLSHYGTTTAEVVPLDQALIIASLIDREAGGPDDMRIISGIIWNRLFISMNLQIDATLQYAKANKVATASWWPIVVPADRYIKSPYNTYLHGGLPPTPIANPSVAAILAALNPVNTPCLFYFHDAHGQFHCSDTYAKHVALLKKYYGQGK